MSLRFVHESQPQRVCFGSGEAAAAVAREVERLGASKVMVIAAAAESELAGRVTAGLPVALRYDEVVMHVPAGVAERAREAAKEHGADALVSVGGGSTTGLAKAIALTSGLPIVAVPTTYAGSEATSVWGLTEGGRKSTGTDPRVLPRVIVYDAELTLSLPVPMSVASGLNALAHCVDSMWAPNADPIDRAVASEGIRALRAGLPAIVADPAGLDGREQALYAAYLSAAAFASAGSGLHHKILSRPRRRLQPAARPDARGGAAVRAGVQRGGGAGGGAADRRGAGRRAGHRRPAGAAPRAVRTARAARLWFRGVRHPGRGRRHRACRAAGQPQAGDGRRPAAAAARGVGWSRPGGDGE